jgi:hypothetical protein
VAIAQAVARPRNLGLEGARTHEEAAQAGSARGAAVSAAAEIARALGGKPNGSGYVAHCPIHVDNTPSLSIHEGDDGEVLLKCHAGCRQDALVGWARDNGHDLSGRRPAKSIVAEYDYCDRSGAIRYQVVRRWPKGFQQRQPDGKGGWQWNMAGIKPLPYKLPQMLAAPDKPVFVVEGEKDADRLAREGLVATCNHGGAGKWRTEICRRFKDRAVVILPDNDPSGRRHAEDVARKLGDVARGVRVVELPDLPPKGDVSDWLDGGKTVRELRGLVHETPIWKPPEADFGPRGGESDCLLVLRPPGRLGTSISRSRTTSRGCARPLRSTISTPTCPCTPSSSRPPPRCGPRPA